MVRIVQHIDTTFLIVFTVMCTLSRTVGETNYFVAHGVQEALSKNFYAADQTTAIGQHDHTLADVNQPSKIYDYLEQIALPLLLNTKTPANEEITSYHDLNFVVQQNKVLWIRWFVSIYVWI